MGMNVPGCGRQFILSQQAAFHRVLASLHEAALDDLHWPVASALIDDACGATGNSLVVVEGVGRDAQVLLGRFFYRGQSGDEMLQDYLEHYYPLDERPPRFRRLPSNQIVHVSDLYTEQELKTSPTYNEALRRSGAQNALNARLDGPYGSRIFWSLVDPVKPGSWESGQIEIIQSLMPHIRHFVRVRLALARAGAVKASVNQILANARVGVIQLDRQGRIIEANDCALGILKQGDGLRDRAGFLHASLPADGAQFERVLALALATSGSAPVSGSVAIERPSGLPRLVVHVNAVSLRPKGLEPRRVAALVLVEAPGGGPPILEPQLTAAVLGVTLEEGQVAVALAVGRSVREIARATGRTEAVIRWVLKQIYRKVGVTRQPDLVRLVLSTAEFAEREHSLDP